MYFFSYFLNHFLGGTEAAFQFWLQLHSKKRPGTDSAPKHWVMLLWLWISNGAHIVVYLLIFGNVCVCVLSDCVLCVAVVVKHGPPWRGSPAPPPPALSYARVPGEEKVAYTHTRRIKTAEKVKVVAAVWGAEFIQSLAALAVLHRSIWIMGWIAPS